MGNCLSGPLPGDYSDVKVASLEQQVAELQRALADRDRRLASLPAAGGALPAIAPPQQVYPPIPVGHASGLLLLRFCHAFCPADIGAGHQTVSSSAFCQRSCLKRCLACTRHDCCA